MGNAGNETEKSQLITQICSILTRANACAHRHHRCAIRSPFIDWYLVLGVAENAGVDSIRKQYHKLALQLHPDKNKHPKAESAFKLVSEAYFCLSDSSRKAAFDSERKNSFCSECSRPPSRRKDEVEGISYPGRKNFNGIIQRMKNLRTRLEEEATIIEKCLKANAASKGEFPFSVQKLNHQFLIHQIISFRAILIREPTIIQNRKVSNSSWHETDAFARLLRAIPRSFNVDQKKGNPVNLDMLVSDLNEQ